MEWKGKKWDIEVAVILLGVLGLEDTREPGSARGALEPAS